MLHHPLMIIPVIDAYPGGVSRINDMYRKKKQNAPKLSEVAIGGNTSFCTKGLTEFDIC